MLNYKKCTRDWSRSATIRKVITKAQICSKNNNMKLKCWLSEWSRKSSNTKLISRSSRKNLSRQWALYWWTIFSLRQITLRDRSIRGSHGINWRKIDLHIGIRHLWNWSVSLTESRDRVKMLPQGGISWEVNWISTNKFL